MIWPPSAGSLRCSTSALRRRGAASLRPHHAGSAATASVVSGPRSPERAHVMASASREQRARDDWEQRIYDRLTDTTDADAGLALPAPTGLRAESGVGHVRLSWEPVPGAAGYLIERTGPDGHPGILGHGGSDVPAVSTAQFADTDVDDGTDYTYRVAAVAGAEYPAWNWTTPVVGHTLKIGRAH